MTMPEQAVRIEGLRELERAFRLYGNGLEKGVREALTTAAEPVRTEAQSLARSSIRNIGLTWSSMRIGVTRRTAYIAPQQRGRRGGAGNVRKGRPNLAPLLLDRAMQPALANNIRNVEQEIGAALDDLGRMWSRV
jgi:hypothetical protein